MKLNSISQSAMRMIPGTRYMLLALFVFPLAFMGCQDPPEACFSIESNIVDQNAPVPFTNCSVFQQKGYLWDFGDGTTSENVSPTHKFRAQGEYLVLLTSKGDRADQDDTYSEVIKVAGRELSAITVNDLPDTKPNGDPWDAADGPDVQVVLQNAVTSAVAFTSTVQSNTTTSGTIAFNSAGSNINLTPELWNFIVLDNDDAAGVDTMQIFEIDLDTYIPNEGLTIDVNDSEADLSVGYLLK